MLSDERSIRNHKNNSGHAGRFRFFKNLVFLAVILITVSLPLAAASPALAAAAVAFSVGSGSPGTSVLVSGTGFSPGNLYSISFDPGTLYEQIYITNAPITGTSFNATITIPPAPWAQHNIRVETSAGTFLQSFQVIPQMETSVNTGFVGDTVVVTGNGFRISASVNIYLNNIVVGTAATDVYGTLAQSTFLVPPLRSGVYNMNANDGVAATPVFIFSVRPRLVLSSTEGSAGDSIILTGTGFDYNSQISALWDNQIVSTSLILTNSTGSFTGNFTIPLGTQGSHTIRVSDITVRIATVSFNVISRIVLSPNNSAPGNTVSVTGSGFRPNTGLTVTYNGITLLTQPPTLITDAAGSFAATFVVPSGTSGNYLVRASDGAFAATAVFGVTSKIILSVAAGNVGLPLQVNGIGFTPAGKVTLTYDAQEMAVVTVDSAGLFTATFNVPASKAGAHTVSATDQSVAGLVISAPFTMESAPPQRPNLTAPETASQTMTAPSFSWSAVSDPSGVSYSLQVARDPSFSNMVLARQGLTNTVYAVAPSEAFGLTKKTNPYYWRVKATDGAGNEGDWSVPFTFYTQDSTPPALPLPLTPGADSQATTLPAFDWSDVSDQSGVTYSFQVSRDPGFSQLVVSKQGLSTSNYQLAQTEQLALTKRISPYYWRVKASDGAANDSEWTAPSSFYTQDSLPPPAPTALRPGASSQQGSQAAFDWTDVTDPSGVTYTLQVSQDSAFNQLVVSKEGLQSSEYKLTGAEKLGSTGSSNPVSYFWRVKAVDGATNDSAWSNTGDFRVKNFLQSGWPVYIAIAIGGLLLLGVGVFIGMRLQGKTTV